MTECAVSGDVGDEALGQGLVRGRCGRGDRGRDGGAAGDGGARGRDGDDPAQYGEHAARVEASSLWTTPARRTSVRLHSPTWDGRTRTCRGRSWSRCWPAARATARASPGAARRRRRRQPGVVAQAGAVRAPRARGAGRAHVPTPSCTATPTSASSTARAIPRSSSSRPHRLGLDAIALTDHDGMYGVVRFAEAAAELGVRTVFGAELSLGLTAPQNGVADPEGSHLLLLARDPDGYRGLCRTISSAQMRGAGEGAPGLRPRRGRRRHRGSRAGAHRLPQGGGPPGPRAGGRSAAAVALRGLVERFGAEHVAVELTHHALPTDTERNDALAAPRPRGGSPDRRLHRGALRHPAPVPAGHGPGRGAGQAQPRRRRRLAARPPAPPTCDPAPRWPPASTSATPARWPGRRRTGASARSPSTWWPRTSRRSRSRRATRRPPGCASSPTGAWPSATAATRSTPRPSPWWRRNSRSSSPRTSPATS